MRFALLVVFIGFVNMINAQEHDSFQIKDEWFEKHGKKGLRVGDRMPDILFGPIINNNTGKKRFSELKGKLVILDFWNSSCSSCIKGFTKMEALQKEFGYKIQILLINPWETQEEVDKRFNGRKKIKLPDLPCIVAGKSQSNYNNFSEPLAKLFPTRGVPHHVWIDKNGFVILRGGSENTYARKIEDYLSGEKISYLNDDASVPSMVHDPKAIYYKQLGSLKRTPMSYGFVITPYNNEIAGPYGGSNQVIDSNSQTRINYFINWEVVQLYQYCFNIVNKFGRDSLRRHVLYTPTPRSDIDFLIFPIKTDTLKFGAISFIANQDFTTEELTRSRYCYEQVLPQHISDEKAALFMLENINKYFSLHYGITAILEERKIPCYILQRTSKEDKVGSAKNREKAYVDIDQNGRFYRRYNWDIQSVFSDIIRSNKSLSDSIIENRKHGKPFILLNETGWSNEKQISIPIPVLGITTMEELSTILNSYDLEIKEGLRELKFIVFKND